MASLSLFSPLSSLHTSESSKPLTSLGINVNPNRFCFLRNTSTPNRKQICLSSTNDADDFEICSEDGRASNFCIIEGPETVQDLVLMQLQEIEDNIRSRRNKIFLLMEELRRLRIQQRIKNKKVVDESHVEENEMPEIPSSIPFLPHVTPKTLKQLYLTSFSFISGILVFGGLVAPTTNFPEYEGHDKIVIRRYSDFVWLKDRLFEKYKGVFIPPLPEKSTVEKFRFSAEFIEMRRQALDVFVNRIAAHHQLQQSEDLRIFLQADEQTMERARSQETGIFKKKPADLMQIFKDVQSKVSDVVLGKEKPVEESSPEYEKLKNYIFQLEDHLAEAQKHAYRLVKRHRELGQSLSDFGKAFKLLGDCEGHGLGKAFSELGSKSEILSIKLQREAQHLLMNFEEPLKDYVRAVQSIKATMAERANAFRHHCELAEAIKFKEIDMNKLRLTRSEKLMEAEHEYEQLKADGAEATRKFETIVRTMNEEIVRFQEQKTLDMGLAFHEFAKGQASLANGIADGWRSLLPKLESLSSSP